jgi:hypothetical protein
MTFPEGSCMIKRVCLLSSCLLMSSIVLAAQTSPAAERGGVAIWVGGEFSTFNPDYGCAKTGPFSCGNNLLGIGTYGDFNHLFLPRLGAEAEARFLHWSGPVDGLSENTYLFGPRYTVWRFRGILDLDAKFLLGIGHINLPHHGQGEGNHFAYAPGVTANFRVSRRWSARVGYEYQIWPGFEGVATSFTSGTGGITPNGLSFGVSYAVLR